MAIKQVIEIEVEAGSAKTNLKDIGAVIQEQKDITIEFEKELRNLEAQLASTSSSNMGKQKVLKTRVTDLKDALKDQRLSLKELNNERGKATKVTEINTKSLSQNYGVVQLLDQVTGGLASQVRSVVDANRLFNFSLKGTRKALIATGVGAFVVALGLIISYWSEISDWVEGTNRKLERQQGIYEQIGLELNHQLELNKLDQQIAKEKGKSVKELIKLEKKLLLKKQQNTADSLVNLETQLAIENSKIREVTLLEKGLTALKAYVFGYQTVGESVVGALGFNVISDLEGKINALKKLAKQTELDLIKIDNPDEDPKTKKGEEKVKVDFDDTAQKKLEAEIKALEELARVRDEFATKNRDNEAVQSEVDRENKLLEIDNLVADEVFKRNAIAEVNKFYDDEADRINEEKIKKIEDDAEKEKQILADIAAAKLAIRNAELDNVANGIGLLASLDKKSKLLQASSIIAENAVGIAKTIIGTQASNTITIAEGAAAAIPTAGASVIAAASLVSANNISAGISIATSIAATAKGLSALGGGGAAGGGGGARGGSAPRAPAFNLVKGSASNQIAESIQGQNKPIKAYVIGSDVTTSQSLDRQIEGDSTL